MAFEYDDEKLKQEAADVAAQKRTLGIMGGIGDILGSQNSFGNYFLGQKNQNNGAVSKTLGSVADTIQDPYERQKQSFEGFKQNQEATRLKDDATLLSEKKDPNSNKSKALRMLAPRWNIEVTPQMSAYDIEQMIDPRKMMETEAISKAQFQNQLALQNNANKNSQIIKGMEVRAEQARNDREKAEKAALKAEELATPYGLAHTADDAKKLKEASDIKASLDADINELIALREKKGGELLDREAVSRAKQLSKGLLLKKKNLESLGVLSASDMDIVNEIIPEDPLQFDASSIAGQDPTMVKLKSFRDDTNRDFETKKRSRLRDYQARTTQSPPRTEVPLAPRDQQALVWAMSNPKDPRAVKIFEKNGKPVGRK